METKGIELDKEREKSIHAKNISILIPINSTHFHTDTEGKSGPSTRLKTSSKNKFAFGNGCGGANTLAFGLITVVDCLLSKAQITICDVDFHFENWSFYGNLMSIQMIVVQKTIDMANKSWGTRISKMSEVENTQPGLREQTGLSSSKYSVPGSKIESIGLPGTL